MAGSSLFTLIDDIAALLDDIATMTKVATQKTATVLTDDLAVNAQQLTGINADRELPVVWTVAKGSFKNKFILVPAALIISAFAPFLITPLLILGGLFLCFEGVEKVHHRLFHHQQEKAHQDELLSAVQDPAVDIVAFEKEKISGAIRTDFILSAEIIVISLGVVSEEPLVNQIGVLSTVAILITVGVYGLVAGIVKLDDAGLFLSKKENPLLKKLGLGLVNLAPYLMKFLSFFGTLAMFLVGGGIISHSIPIFETWAHHITEAAHHLLGGTFLSAVAPTLFNLVLGFIAGVIVLMLVSLAKKVMKKESAAA